MSEQPEVTDTDIEDALEEVLSPNAIYRVEVKTTILHDGTSHWLGVSLEDGPVPVEVQLVDEDGDVVGTDTRLESGEELIFRIETLALRRLHAVVGKFRRTTEERKALENAARAAARQTNESKETPS